MNGPPVDDDSHTMTVDLSDGTVTVHDAGDFVTVVEFDRGPNSFFDRELIIALADVLEDLSSRSDVRAVVLCSAGRHFCAGAKLAPTGRAEDAFAPHLYDAASRFIRQPVPIVAAVQGRAVGGGFGLAMACDFRIAADNATFDSAFARLGIHHGFGLTVTLPDAIGSFRARRLLFQQISVKADEALSLGLCEIMTPESDLRSSAVSFARTIAASAPLAVRAIRQTMRQELVALYDAAVQHERLAQTVLRNTDDAVEGIKAQRERRKPDFVGR